MQLLLALCVLLMAAPPTHEVRLVTGEVLRGQLVEQTPQKVVIDHEVLGRIEIAGDAVAEIVVLPAQPPPPAPQPAPPPAAPQQLAADEPFLPDAKSPPTKWKSRFELGLAAATGVTDTTNLRLGFKTGYDSQTQKYAFLSSYYYAKSEGEVTNNKFNFTALGDWPFRGSRWSVFGQGTYDYDSFQSWKQRVTGGGGFRYVIVDLADIDGKGKYADRLLLNGRIGVGARKEFGSVNEDVVPEAIVGADLIWKMTAKQQLVAGLTVYPDLEEVDNYRVTSKAEWVYNLADLWDGLNLVIGYAYEYQAQTSPGINKNTLNFYISLAIGF